MSEYKFGVEIECFLPYGHEDKFLEELEAMKCDPTDDGSIYPPDGSTDVEIRTPILKKKEVLPFFRKLEKKFAKHKVKANTSCGLHVHVSNDEFFKAKNMKKINLTWLAIEDVLFSLQNKRRMTNEYCARKYYDYIEQAGLRKFGNSKSAYSYSNDLRFGDRDALNFNAMLDHGTIECRAHTGTTDVERILNWIYLLNRFYDYCLNDYNAKTVKKLFKIPCSKEKAEEVWNLIKLDKKRKEYFNKATNPSLYAPLNKQFEAGISTIKINSKIKWYKNRFKIYKSVDFYSFRSFTDGSYPQTLPEKKFLQLEIEKRRALKKFGKYRNQG